jgi:hypothetical protein
MGGSLTGAPTPDSIKSFRTTQRPTMNFTLTRPNLIKLLFVPLLVFFATLVAVKVIDSSSGRGSAGAGAGASAAGFADARTTDERIRSLQAAVKDDTTRAAPYAALGDAYLQKAR